MSAQSFVAMMPREMMELHTRPLFAFQADVAKPSIIGLTPGHDRRVGVITGVRRLRRVAPPDLKGLRPGGEFKHQHAMPPHLSRHYLFRFIAGTTTASTVRSMSSVAEEQRRHAWQP